MEGVQCELAYCSEPATGRGCHFDQPLCAAHLKVDADNFKEAYYAHRKATIEEPIKILDERIYLTRGALFELTSDRAEVSDMFDEILECVQRCRERVLGKLDAKIATTNVQLKSLEYCEKLKLEMKKAESTDNLVESYLIIKKMQLSLRDAPLTAEWNDPVDTSVEMGKKLQDAVEELSAEAEGTQGLSINNVMVDAAPKATYHNAFPVNTPTFISSWNQTDGFYYAANGIVKVLQNGYQQFPKEVIYGIALNGTNWYFAYYNTSFILLCQFNVARSATPIVSAQCVSHRQEMFIITNDNNLTVTDPMGTQMQTVALGDFDIGAACSMAHDKEKVYILGATGRIVSLSLGEFKQQDKILLPEDAKGAHSLTKLGRNLLVTNTTGVHRVSVVTKRFVPVWKYDPTGIQQAIDIGFGLTVVFCDLIGKVIVLGSGRTIINEISVPQLGLNNFQHCQACNRACVCQSLSACCLLSSKSVCLYLRLGMQCSHQQLVMLKLI